MSYGADRADVYRRATPFVDKMRTGAKPGNLPIKQPTTVELVINLTTAEALGLTLPSSRLCQANEVIRCAATPDAPLTRCMVPRPSFKRLETIR
jgi:putative ABC transport system substrate-binding protein